MPEWPLTPMLTDMTFYAVALPAVALYGLAKGGLSGVGLLAIPLMSLLMSPVQAAAILLPVLLVQDIVTVYSFRHSWSRDTLVHLLPGAALGICLGAVTAAVVTPDQIRLAVGLLAVVFCLNAWLGTKPTADAPKPQDWCLATGLGALAGYSSFVIHAGGVPYNFYTLPRITTRPLFVGTNVFKIMPYWGLGQLTATNLQLAAALLPAAVLANLGGIWVVRHIPTALFYKAIYGLTFCVGVKLIVDGSRAIWGL
jgi:uncharacterized protein